MRSFVIESFQQPETTQINRYSFPKSGASILVGAPDSFYLPLCADSDDEIPHILLSLQEIAIESSQNKFVRDFAINVAAPRYNNDLFHQVKQLELFVKNKMIYVADPLFIETFKMPVDMINDIITNGVVYGDCDDHVLLFLTLAMALGIECKAVGVMQNVSEGLIDHVIASVKIYDKWHDIDLCVKYEAQPNYSLRMEVC